MGAGQGIQIRSTCSAQTEGLGRVVGEWILGAAAAPRVIALRGELGAGKTVFVRGLVRGYLLDDSVPVQSPTYVLLHIYRDRGGSKEVQHLDAYRMTGGEGEVEASGLQAYLEPTCAGILCVEWPERVSRALPERRIEVFLEHQDPTVRTITITATPECKSIEGLIDHIRKIKSYQL